jgi:DNA-binding PadR family transcriptional regulator
MSFGHALLGLLEEGPQHGYELKHRYDANFPGARPLPFGQVYATLARLHRDGLVDIAAVESGAGPDRKLYVITPAGVTDLERWVDEPTPVGLVRSELLSRVVVALISGRNPDAVLDAQRAEHLSRMREVTERRRTADLVGAMACDFELFHLEADVKWIEHSARRLDAKRGRRTKGEHDGTGT